MWKVEAEVEVVEGEGGESLESIRSGGGGDSLVGGQAADYKAD